MFTIRLPIERFLCYDEPVYSPFDGEVVQRNYGASEPRRIQPFFVIAKFLGRAMKATSVSLMARSADDMDLANYLGNHIIVRIRENMFCPLVHLSNSSPKYKIGERVTRGQIIGKVGHTGDSTSPHLHFQLMDSDKMLTAKSLSFRFAKYEVYQNNRWQAVELSVPKSSQIMRD